ncbi:hypothetical protein [Isoptericola nanjingensis]|uniref:hypothetical protein n=1 Tax=Isoptericola TaxID=254250 RepID=UPI0035EB72CF|nr:hypothetical protein [Isoptericola sp. QY 916]
MDARSRRWWFTAVLVLFFVLSAVRLALTIRRDGVEDATLWIALLVVALIVVVTLAVVVRRAGAVADHVARRRPGAVVVPAFTTSETLDEARTAGAPTRGIAPVGGSPAALAVVGDRVEVWVRREAGPRWAVRRVPGGTTQVEAAYGTRETPALRVADDGATVTVVPAYHPLRATGGLAGGDVARAVHEVSTAS